MDLLALPTEVLVLIFLNLSVSDSLHIQSVNRLFRSLYQDSLQLQYALECQIAGVHDNPRCSLPIQYRLRMLRDRESSWDSLVPTSREDVQLPTRTSGHYDLAREHFFLGDPHPMAAKPLIPIHYERPMQPSNDQVHVSVEACGENLFLAVRISDDPSWLYVFSWQTGELKFDPIGFPNLGLVVLRHDIILNPNIRNHCLDIYYVPASSSGGPINRIARLCLPALKDDANTWDIQCRAAPNPTEDSTLPRNISASIPFVDRADCAIILLTWQIHRDDNEFVTPFSFVVHRQSILDLLPPEMEWPSLQAQTTAWDFWGPSRTCLFNNMRFAEGYITATNGQRYILHSAEPRQKSQLRLLDFNRYKIKRSLAKGSPRVQLGMQSEPLNHFFAQSETDALPFLEIVADVDRSYHGVMINDSAILGLNSAQSSSRG
ncbi:hypothetical protein P691DRAFT_791239 [Macrolepiota fuliginosa MF-IS2]|uniref:F-box domain-containing protein n=1 Tax=Macrolepiota fuliginosa MF-IS2 TaxID=1400762 RepID=A0A9P5WZN6_9AGAR|nr:hypothetical protein P691DRAFT_791239 [Macrolepiota fuliginosa MF-IS2]